jgi:hypothetical protein
MIDRGRERGAKREREAMDQTKEASNLPLHCSLIASGISAEMEAFFYRDTSSRYHHGLLVSFIKVDL